MRVGRLFLNYCSASNFNPKSHYYGPVETKMFFFLFFFFFFFFFFTNKSL